MRGAMATAAAAAAATAAAEGRRRLPQTTRHLLMVRPLRFGSNPETLEDNAFQGGTAEEDEEEELSVEEVARRGREEFDAFVAGLRRVGVDVSVAEDTEEPLKPDCVFPNNWISCHADGTLVTYPMLSPLRRAERRPEIVELIKQRFVVEREVAFEEEGHEEDAERAVFLEGTGSMIFDHPTRTVYACHSRRTDTGLLQLFCERFEYEPIVFTAYDKRGVQPYHTNVVMSIGEDLSVICLDSIRDQEERRLVQERLQAAGKEVMDISLDQMDQFAGNMLQVRGASSDAGLPDDLIAGDTEGGDDTAVRVVPRMCEDGGSPPQTAGNAEGEVEELFLIMSRTAFRSLTEEQIALARRHCHILHVRLDTIEQFGGGSARCMMAEVFLAPRPDV